MLDLRAASLKTNSSEKWYPLINSKIGGAFRPEIKLSFCLSPPSDSVEIMPPVKRAPKKAPKLQTTAVRKPNVVPQLVLDSAYSLDHASIHSFGLWRLSS